MEKYIKSFDDNKELNIRVKKLIKVLFAKIKILILMKI